MKRNLALSFLLSAMLLIAVSCEHKGFSEISIAEKVQVVFDWNKAPDASVKQMAFYLYSDSRDVARHWFSNPAGGIIKSYPGAFTAVCHNDDNSFELLVRNHHSHDEIEIYTEDTYVLTGQNLSTAGIPRAPGTEGEPMRATPSMCYGSNIRDILLFPTDTLQTITLYPEELVCHYTVEFINVENLSRADIMVDGALTSMAGGYLPGKLKATQERVSHTFTFSTDIENKRLISNFLTFGVPEGDTLDHMVSLYVVMSDRRGSLYTYNVSDQVNEAPDPRNVHIVISGLSLPEVPDTPPPSDPNSPGMNVGIDDWNVQNFDVKVPSGQ